MQTFISSKDYRIRVSSGIVIWIRRRERNSGREAYRDFADAVSDALANQELRADIADRLIEKILVRYNKSFEIVLRYQDEFAEEAARVG